MEISFKGILLEIENYWTSCISDSSESFFLIKNTVLPILLLKVQFSPLFL